MLLKSSDLTRASNEGAKNIRALIEDQEDAQLLINAIEDFISSSVSKLKGSAYDSVRIHMQQYITILQERIKVANSIIESIKSANSEMLNYMDGEHELNTDDLDYLRGQLTVCKANRDAAYSKVNTYDNRKDNENALYNYQRFANECKVISEKIHLLEGLASKDNAVYSSLSGIEGEVNSYKNLISEVDTIRITST